jgi:carbamoyltransferase
MITWGISANSHNAAVAVFSDDQLVFATETERWSGVKNDPHLVKNLNSYLFDRNLIPDKVVWYERPLLKSLRQAKAGQWDSVFENNIKSYVNKSVFPTNIEYAGHHESHAAAGYYTSKFDNACVVVIDAIGEFDTLTIWKAEGSKLKKVYAQRYPHSLGLWYSAMTQRVGLKPNEEEYILMGMAAYGNPNRLADRIANDFVKDFNKFTFKQNLHRGCKDWAPELGPDDIYDIAAGTQQVYEQLFDSILKFSKKLVPSDNLVLMGGCALNCAANGMSYNYFKNLWIMPAPGDSGSAIGAVLAKKRTHIPWRGPFLGYDMGTKNSNAKIVEYLLEHKICGIARGPAEFGPRALGNRSLIADPRGNDIKEQVNEIKQRQQFRPFAPAILADVVHDYFDMPGGSLSPYMQVVARCRHPQLYPAIIHADGTSRVQTVGPEDNLEFYNLLQQWYKATGCPILLNTSLNIKGQPMVNNHIDARTWQSTYGVRVFN